MDRVRVVLTLISIAIVVVPIAGMLLAYRNNLLGLIIPPEATDIVNTLSNIDSFGEPEFEPVGPPQYNETSRTVTMTFQFKNTYPFDISINAMSGDIKCVAHGTHLGVVTLDKKVSVGVGETKTITVLGVWTPDAVNHVKNTHAGEKTIEVNMVGFTVNVSGLILQMDQRMEIPNPFT